MPRARKSPAVERSERYFRRVLLNERRIQMLEDEIEMQQSRLALNGVEGGESVRKTMEGDALERGYQDLYGMCDRMDSELSDYVRLREQARKVMGRIESPYVYEAMYHRYFMGLRPNDIAKVMFVSRTTVYNLLDAGVRVCAPAVAKVCTHLDA